MSRRRLEPGVSCVNQSPLRGWNLGVRDPALRFASCRATYNRRSAALDVAQHAFDVAQRADNEETAARPADHETEFDSSQFAMSRRRFEPGTSCVNQSPLRGWNLGVRDPALRFASCRATYNRRSAALDAAQRDPTRVPTEAQIDSSRLAMRRRQLEVELAGDYFQAPVARLFLVRHGAQRNAGMRQEKSTVPEGRLNSGNKDRCIPAGERKGSTGAPDATSKPSEYGRRADNSSCTIGIQIQFPSTRLRSRPAIIP